MFTSLFALPPQPEVHTRTINIPPWIQGGAGPSRSLLSGPLVCKKVQMFISLFLSLSLSLPIKSSSDGVIFGDVDDSVLGPVGSWC